MIEKGLLKNVEKFNNIKLAKGVNIELFVMEQRKVGAKDIGISTETFGDKWVYTPKGRAIFKTYDSKYGDNIRKVRIVNELLCKQMCDQINLGCATYEPAYIYGQDGLLTYDITDGKKLVSVEEFLNIKKHCVANLEETIKIIDKYIKKGYKIDKKKVVIGLYQTILFDTLTLQTDRNVNNINFLYDKTKKEITLAKLIDNEFAFCGEFYAEPHIDIERLKKSTFADIIYEYSLTGKIYTFDDTYCANRRKFLNNVENLVYYAKKHKALNNVLNYTLNNLNPKNAIENLEKKGVVINNDYKKLVCNVINNVKEIIMKEKAKRMSRQEIEELENLY